MNKICQRCRSKRIIRICGKTDDRCNVVYKDIISDGYVLADIGIGAGGNYIYLTYCLECGQIQGNFPVWESTVLDQIDRTRLEGIREEAV